MLRCNLSRAVLVLLLMTLVASRVAAEDPAKSPEDIFKARGLIKTGFMLVLPQENALHDAAIALRTAKGKLNAAAQKIRDADAQIKTAERNLKAMEDDLHDTNVRMAAGQNDNQLIGRHNLLLDEIKKAYEQLDKIADDRQKLLMSRSDYITATLDASEKADAALHAYDIPQGDKELAAAIDKFNLTAKPKVRLGPSATFNDDLDLVKKCKADVTSGAIPVTLEGGVPNVEVLINGKVTERFIWDSGCTGISLSAKTASDLGIHPSDKDRIVESTIADGSKIKEHVVVLDSVRIGPYTVEHLECTIPAKGSVGADLLGNEFQHHFQFKLDVNSLTLQLTPLDAQAVSIKAPKPTAVAIAHKGKPFRAQVQEYPWEVGQSQNTLIPANDGFCILSMIAGDFRSYEDSESLEMSDDGSWAMRCNQVHAKPSPRFLVYQVKPDYAYESQVSFFKWINGQSRIKMIRADEGMCFLSGISGHFAGRGEHVEIVLDDDNYWYLVGASGQSDLSATAVAVKFPEVNKVGVSRKILAWKRGQGPVRLMPKDKGICGLLGIGGLLNSEQSRAGLKLDFDGFWYLSGQTAGKDDELFAEAVVYKYPDVPESNAGAAPDKPNSTSKEGDAAPSSPKKIDLLALVDAGKDAIKGKWHKEPKAIVAESGSPWQLNLRYIPPEEYDLRVEFTRMAGKESIIEQLPLAGKPVTWVMGGDGDSWCGFASNKGTRKVASGSGVGPGHHVSLIKVRKNDLSAYLDGQLITSGVYIPELGVINGWEPTKDGGLCIGCNSNVKFDVIELTEITGKGSAAPAADSVAKPPAAKPDQLTGVWFQPSSGDSFTLSADGIATSKDNKGTWTANTDGSVIQIKWATGGWSDIYRLSRGKWTKYGYQNGTLKFTDEITPP